MARDRYQWRGASRALAQATALCGMAVGLAVAVATPAAALMPDRAYELVSPPDKRGAPVTPTAIRNDGAAVLLNSGGGFAGTESQSGLFNSYSSVRTSLGWRTSPLNLSARDYKNPGERVDSTADLGEHLMLGFPGDAEGNAMRFDRRDASGRLVPASPLLRNILNPTASAEVVTYAGASKDFDHIFFRAKATTPVLPGETSEVGAGSLYNLYEVYGARGSSPQVRRVDVDNTNAIVGFRCGREFGGDGSTLNAISVDGAKVFFSGRRPPTASSCIASVRGPIRVFARVGGVTTMEVSASECDRVADPGAVPPVTACTTVPANAPDTADARFRGASRDGSVVMLTTSQQLANSDTDTTDDLYEYRWNPVSGQRHLTQVTAAPGQSATPGNGARSLGVVHVADDGSRVYFVAQGVLTTDPGANGSSAISGANNLYVFERTASVPSGRIRFITALAGSGDESLWGVENDRQAQLSDESGRFLLFSSAERLTPDDTDAVADVYRYDAQQQELVRISHAKDGFDTNGNSVVSASFTLRFTSAVRQAPRPSAITADGSGVVFMTAEALQAEDANGTVDLYEWRDGQVELVTNGVDAPSADISSAGITPDGKSIVFGSASRLTPDDVDGTQDTYVARRGGGFPVDEPEVPSVCDGEACQGPVSGSPVVGPPATSGFVGAGNLLEPPRPAVPVVRVGGASRVRGLAVRLTVRPSSAGVVRISGAGVRGQRRRVAGSGAVKVAVRLSAVGAKRLARRGRVSTVIHVRLASAPGAAKVTKRVVFVRSRAKSRIASRAAVGVLRVNGVGR